MSKPTLQEIGDREQQIRTKRLHALLGSYELMRNRFTVVRDGTRLDKGLAAAVVEEYLTARRLIVGRDNISGRIQRHKIAGLMASSIVKVRPIQLVEGDPDAKATRLSRDNEYFAVLHGLAICAEGKGEAEIGRVLALRHFDVWFADVVQLLHHEPGNGAAVIMVFGTLSLTQFPENLDHSMA